MKKAILLFGISMFTLGCNSATQNTQSSAPTTNTNTSAVSRVNDSAIAPGHSTGKSDAYANTSNSAMPAKPEGQAKPFSSGGDPIDTEKFDAEIAKAEKDLKAKPTDESAKKAMAQAYFNRAVALTDARQYASALGDYRRTLKHDPDNEEAKSWIGQITTIYKSLKKDAPEEGKEPPPLPFKKPESKA